MSLRAVEHILQHKLHFFDLPREIRDEIYRHYSKSTPQQQGALEDYATVPSPASLRICKQIYAELSPIFYESLKTCLLQDRVCIRLRVNKSNGRASYVGWSIWTHDKSKCFSTWLRVGHEEESMAGWWMSVQRLSPREMESNPHVAYRQMSKEILLWAEMLEKLTKVPQITCVPIRARLLGLQKRVAEIVEVVRKLEDARKEAKLRETRSQGYTLRAEATDAVANHLSALVQGQWAF